MSKITIQNKDFHVYADKKARAAMTRYSCDPKDLLAPLTEVDFVVGDKARRITVEVKINDNPKGNFIIQPTLVEDQKWFIMTFTNLAEKPTPLYDTKYKVKLSCGHDLVVDTTVDDLMTTADYECHICQSKKRKV